MEITTEIVSKSIEEIWGGTAGHEDWYREQAAEENDGLDYLDEKSLFIVADKIGASPEETDEVGEVMERLISRKAVMERHAEGVCEYRERNLSEAARERRAMERLGELHFESLR